MSSDLERFLARARACPTQSSPTTSPVTLPALRGRLAELSASGPSATLTAAIGLIAEAQEEHEPVAWIGGSIASFYPPDVAASGIDLGALVVVRTPQHSATAIAHAAERLLRSGAFGLLVLDLMAREGAPERELAISSQGRLVTLAQAHDTAVVCVTEKSEHSPSIGSLVSLRAEAVRRGLLGGEFEVTLRVLKDKRRGPGATRSLKARGPAGI